MSKPKSKRPIRILDYTQQQVLRRTDEEEAQNMIDRGDARRVSANEIVLYRPREKMRAAQRIWAPAPSLLVSPAVVRRFADGSFAAQQIVAGYGTTSERHPNRDTL